MNDDRTDSIDPNVPSTINELIEMFQDLNELISMILISYENCTQSIVHSETLNYNAHSVTFGYLCF